MSKQGRSLSPWAWGLGIMGAWVVVGLALQQAHGEADSPRPTSDATAAKLLAEEYVNPVEIAEHFCRQLGEAAKEKTLPSPQELASQQTNSTNVPIAAEPDPGKRLSSQEVYARARKGVVVIGAISPCPAQPHWHGKYATGFVIGRNGIIVTNAHVIEAFEDSEAIGVMTADGRVFPVRSVLAADRTNDVAVLKISAEDLVPLPVAATVPIGATIYCLSHPALDCAGTKNAFYTFTRGIASGKFRLKLGGKKFVNALAITADYAQGSSGGPILNEHGAVVGIVCQTLSLCAGGDSSGTQMTWKIAMPSSSILALLKD